jgi:hypothetical protein
MIPKQSNMKARKPKWFKKTKRSTRVQLHAAIRQASNMSRRIKKRKAQL